MAYDNETAAQFRYLALMERRLFRLERLRREYQDDLAPRGLRLLDVAIRATKADIEVAHDIKL